MINDLFYEGDTFFTNKNEKILSKETYALELYNMYNTFFSGKDVVTPKVVNGSTHEGKIIRIDTEYVLVDLGYKDYVFCPRKKENVTVLSNIEVEQIVKVYIEKIHDAPYMIEGNISKLFEDDIKTFIFDLIERQEPVPAFIKEWTPAGYMLNININNFDFVAFMPNTIAGVNKLSNPEMLVGKTEMVILESFSQENKTFIASRKRYLETLILQEVSKLKVNQEYTGSVTGTLEYGIFVEFNGCLTGMIYKSNLNDE
jgi:ribosomal protein S1